MNRMPRHRQRVVLTFGSPNDNDYSVSCHPCAGRGPGNMRGSLDSHLRGNDNGLRPVRVSIQESIVSVLGLYARGVVA